ncbi:20558_t:CDS:1 [Dentiscutata erythropus]|uniref:20558_t:CDS:1 n=1 Tax=Dentiscutata erythropus TaxID=1348616 RepID=A0A9N9EIP4_9GLOM|nr:20558_t:CDS:1 [Dentiscutata erythropus]
MSDTLEIPPKIKLILRHDWAKLNSNLPKLIETLTKELGSTECWHKKSTFFEHLFHVYQILTIWNQPQYLIDCGLFHSAYSNSYVNLAIFKLNNDINERKKLESLIGEKAENFAHLFCIIPRHDLIFNQIFGKLNFNDLEEDNDEKLRIIIPDEGIKVQNINTNEPIILDKFTLALFLIFTMADFSDQVFGWQDELFENYDGQLLFYQKSNDEFNFSLWPGDCKPGLWLTCLSRIGKIIRWCLKDSDPELIPPVFNNCTVTLEPLNLIKSRDLYWEVVTINNNLRNVEAIPEIEKKLKECIEINPFVAEPHVLLAQIYMRLEKYEEAEQEGLRALKIFFDWGTCWDKRMNWDVWIAYVRVVIDCARKKEWFKNGFDTLKVGLVPGI